MKKLSKEIVEIIENNGFYATKIEENEVDYFIELNQYTPLGEDWFFTIWFDGTNKDFIKQLYDFYENFDQNEEVKQYIKIIGSYGVPNDVQALLDDQKWKKDKLEQLSQELNNLIYLNPEISGTKNSTNSL